MTYRLALHRATRRSFLATARRVPGRRAGDQHGHGDASERLARESAEGRPRARTHPRWWVTVHDEATTASSAWRCGPRRSSRTRCSCCPMPDDAARALADAVAAAGRGGHRGERRAARRSGPGRDPGPARRRAPPTIHEHTRLHVLGDLVEPPAPPGRLRAATARRRRAVSLAWFQGFVAEAAEQAGGRHAPDARLPGRGAASPASSAARRSGCGRTTPARSCT